MSDNNSALEDNANRLNPLKLAQRKKPCVYCPATQMNVLINDFCSAVREIPSFTTDDILVERYTPCAVSMPWLPVLLHVWGKMRTSQKSHLHLSSRNGFIMIPFLLRLMRLCQTQDPEGTPGISKALAIGTSSLWASHGGDWRGHHGDGRVGASSITQSFRNPFHVQKLQKGISSARSDDTKSLKGIVVDWLTPRDAPLLPPLSRNVKTNRGFHHPVTGRLLCPAGLDWSDDE